MDLASLRLRLAAVVHLGFTDTFPGLGPDYVRVAVRPATQVTRLVTALTEALAAVAA